MKDTVKMELRRFKDKNYWNKDLCIGNDYRFFSLL